MNGNDPTPGRVIAIVGAESTGKTTLATALHGRLATEGRRVALVGEVLREFCARHGRTPRLDEQTAIAAEQTRRIEAAAQSHDVVVADTTALMIAVYSDYVFGDRGLYEQAERDHARLASFTLLTALDLPWQADGLQRDGPQVREPVDDRLRALLAAAALPWSLVAGLGPARVQAALSACTPLLGPAAAAVADPGKGLFTRLSASTSSDAGWRIDCERCSDPGCEHLSLLAARSMRALS